MTLWLHGRRVGVACAVAISVALAAAGCGSGSATGDVDKIQVVISQLDLTVTNTAGRALLDVHVEILPVGRATAYTTRIPRIENGEKRSLGFHAFSDKSGIQFSPRTARPQAVAVIAADIDGKNVRVEVPWKK